MAMNLFALYIKSPHVVFFKTEKSRYFSQDFLINREQNKKPIKSQYKLNKIFYSLFCLEFLYQ